MIPPLNLWNVSEPERSPGQRPDFAWIPESKGLAKVFMGARKRQDVRTGRSLRFFVFSWGVTWIHGAEEVSADWDDVTHVWRAITRHSANGSPTYTDYQYTLRLADGRSRSFRGSLPARRARASGAVRLKPTPGMTTPVTIEQLGRLLETGVTRAQLPKAIDRLNAGKSVSFGPLTLNPSGIAVRGQSLPWDEIEEVQTRKEVVSVRKSGKWLAWKRARVSEIPNYSVFDALVRANLSPPPSATRF
jgi:hypothetical protein